MIFSPELILKHIMTYLPRLTDLFNTNVNVSGQIIAGSPQILRINYDNHGFDVGKGIVLANALIDNSIIAKTFYPDDDILRLTTNKTHDLTFAYEDNLNEGKIELRGFTDSNLNGFHELIAVASSTVFDISYTSDITLNGNEVLREIREIGIEGIFEVSNVIDVNNFEVELTGLPEFDILPIPQLQLSYNYNMEIVADIDRAEQLYTKNTSNSLFVIMENCIASKDQRIDSDSIALPTVQNLQRQRTLNDFSIVVFLPTKNDLSGSKAVQLCWTDIFTYMLNTMTGVKFEDFDNSQFLTVFKEHGQTRYNNAYYGHAYTFEYSFDIQESESFIAKFPRTVAFRRVDVSYQELQNGSYNDLPQ